MEKYPPKEGKWHVSHKRRGTQGRVEALLYLSMQWREEATLPSGHGLVAADPSASPRFTLTYGFWTVQDKGKRSRSISHHITDVLGTGVREYVRAAALVMMSQAQPKPRAGKAGVKAFQT